MNGSNGDDGPPVLHSILLFFFSARLWLSLNHNHDSQRDKCADDGAAVATATSSRLPPPPPPHRRLSWSPLPTQKGVERETDDDDKNETGDGRSGMCRRKRRMSEGEIHTHTHSLLMERISHSDAVLTRETSLDFQPKNSNWSHFENYAPSFSPFRRESISESVVNGGEEKNKALTKEEEEGDFLWSDPPSLNRVDSTPQLADIGQQDGGQRNSRLSSVSEEILELNAGFLPSRLVLIRHGQSEGNIDETLYATKPDNAMRLTKLGWDMARMAGRALREELPPNETVHFIVSPYARTVETFHGIVSAWCDPEDFSHVRNRSKRLKSWYTTLMEMGLSWHEDPRIREQDFGNYQDPQLIKKAKSERHKFGSFYYRFPHGESASDVFDRVSTFLDSLWRSFESGRSQNYVLVAHGISIRVFLARYFRYSIDQFNLLANPKNCEMVVLAHDGLGRLKLDGRYELELGEVKRSGNEVSEKDDDNHMEERKGAAKINGKANTVDKKAESTLSAASVTGYRKHVRLRTLPPNLVRPRTVRMCYNDN